MNIVVVVEGGCVSTVYVDGKEVSYAVLDWDDVVVERGKRPDVSKMIAALSGGKETAEELPEVAAWKCLLETLATDGLADDAELDHVADDIDCPWPSITEKAKSVLTAVAMALRHARQVRSKQLPESICDDGTIAPKGGNQ